jgi:hypothetical protein
MLRDLFNFSWGMATSVFSQGSEYYLFEVLVFSTHEHIRYNLVILLLRPLYYRDRLSTQNANYSH